MFQQQQKKKKLFIFYLFYLEEMKEKVNVQNLNAKESVRL